MGIKDRLNKYIDQLEVELKEEDGNMAYEPNEMIEEEIPSFQDLLGDEETEAVEEVPMFAIKEEVPPPVVATYTPSSTLKMTTKTSIETSTLSADTRIIGDIFSGSNLIISGQVKGNIESTNNILINGELEGNVTGLNVSVNRNITGDIVCVEDLDVSNGANIIGNVTATNAKIEGVVSGNVQVTGKIELTNTSSLFGDITCGAIKVEEGAGINGRIEIERHD